MARTVSLTLLTADTPLPSGGSFSGYRYSLGLADNSAAPVTQDVPGTTVDFANVAVGSYTATVQALDSSSQPFGNVATVVVDVVDVVPVTYAAPVGLGYTLK